MMLISHWEETIFFCEDSWEKNTLNSKVINWTVEIEHQIKLKYIKSINILWHMLWGRICELDLDVRQGHGSEGQEYEYCIFEQLPSVSTIQKVPHKATMTVNEVNIYPTDAAIHEGFEQ